MTSASYYDQNADEFFTATIGADMAETRNRFLSHVSVGKHVLDAGCGSGRDAAAFRTAGYKVTAFDASEALVMRATKHTGLPVLHMTFEDIAWVNQFDGIWACASLLHVPCIDLARIIKKLATTLRPSGVFYGSFKYGDGQIERDGRTFTNQTQESLTSLMKAVPSLVPIDLWISQDVRPERTDKWLNFLYKQEKY